MALQDGLATLEISCRTLGVGNLTKGSKLDALLEAGKPIPPPEDEIPSIPGVPDPPKPGPPPPPQKPVGSFIRFENDLDLTPTFKSGAFTFTPPKDGLLLGESGPVKHLTTKQRIAQMAKNIRQKRAQMLRNSQN